MVFHGFQKLTLLDYPGQVACTLFTAGCNFRCPFCHNASLVTKIDNQTLYTQEEILDHLKKRSGILDGVCITGGEPLLQEDLADFLKEVKKLSLQTKLDTNGSNPQKLISLVENKLIDYVAMDIKNTKEKYSFTAGVENLDITSIEESVTFLLQNNVDYEFRTTVVNEFHTVEDIKSIGEWLQGAKRYYLQNFENSGNLIDNTLSSVTIETLKAMAEIAEKYINTVAIRGI